MDEQGLLGILRELEWSGCNDTNTDYACPSCGKEKRHGHNRDCALESAIAFVQDKCDKEAAWKTIMQGMGPGQIIAVPAEPRVYGVWQGEAWQFTIDWKLLTFASERLAKAYQISAGDKGQVREIGPDGLPVGVTP